MLDLSAAFDAIDHVTLLTRLKNEFGIDDAALNWFESYLEDRYQTVCVDEERSTPACLRFGVPQGSVLGPKLFTMYTRPLGNIITNHNLKYHLYADDSQTYILAKPYVLHNCRV